MIEFVIGPIKLKAAFIDESHTVPLYHIKKLDRNQFTYMNEIMIWSKDLMSLFRKKKAHLSTLYDKSNKSQWYKNVDDLNWKYQYFYMSELKV